MDTLSSKKLHSEVSLAGFRAHAATVGLLQLIRELRRVEVLDDAAVGRVRDAVVADLALSRPVHETESAFRERLKARLDRLLDPQRDG